jgi:tetratricopeptide (TPR) repeat protein
MVRVRVATKFGILCVCLAAAVCGGRFPPIVSGQDTVFLKTASAGRSTIRGKITSTSPQAITIKSGNKTEDLSPDQVKKLSIAGEPSELDRARDRLVDGRYEDCLAELKKITEEPATDLVRQEIEFLQAFATAHLALTGDASITAQTAGSGLNTFIQKNGNSYQITPALEMLGRLLIAVGKPDLAEVEFAKLVDSAWNEYSLRGRFFLGESQILQDKFAEAQQTYEAILGLSANDDLTQQYKLLATCQLAKTKALQGRVDEARTALEQVIRDENPDNERLFAYAYNALGICHVKSEDWDAAVRAFLHTDLLFASEADPHAEALFHLSQIWPKLEQADRASRARETLKSRHRNSYWALKL